MEGGDNFVEIHFEIKIRMAYQNSIFFLIVFWTSNWSINYLSTMGVQVPGGVTAAEGFKAAGIYGGLRAKGKKPDLALVACDVDAISAGRLAFTSLTNLRCRSFVCFVLIVFSSCNCMANFFLNLIFILIFSWVIRRIRSLKSRSMRGFHSGYWFAITFLYRCVYNEYGCCCTSVILQKDIGHFRKGIPKYLVELQLL